MYQTLTLHVMSTLLLMHFVSSTTDGNTMCGMEQVIQVYCFYIEIFRTAFYYRKQSPTELR